MEPPAKQLSVASVYFPALVAGATAGLSVDVALYPLDTLKTRLQAQQGFIKAGGFNGLYKGLLTVAATSMPTSALFFMSYESTKALLLPHVATSYAPFVHMLAASVGEVVACVIRVPTEIAKQRKQTYVGTGKRSAFSILLQAYKSEGFCFGVYRGFLSTVARDLPFSFIELPVWELLKTTVAKYNDGKINSVQSAFCGSIAGGFAAAVTTPLDLAKTRIMLAGRSAARLGSASETVAETRTETPPVAGTSTNTEQATTSMDGSGNQRILTILEQTYYTGGVRALFAGAAPRTTAFMIGGFVFFGVYDHVKLFLEEKMR